MATIYTHTNCNIAYEIKAIQNICKGKALNFFAIQEQSGMDFNHLADVLTIMMDGMMIDKQGEGMRDSVYSY